MGSVPAVGRPNRSGATGRPAPSRSAGADPVDAPSSAAQERVARSERRRLLGLFAIAALLAQGVELRTLIFGAAIVFLAVRFGDLLDLVDRGD